MKPGGRHQSRSIVSPFRAFLMPAMQPVAHATGRDVSVSTNGISSLRKRNGVLQTLQLDANLKKGNSGGLVLNSKGQVTGIVAKDLADSWRLS